MAKLFCLDINYVQNVSSACRIFFYLFTSQFYGFLVPVLALASLSVYESLLTRMVIEQMTDEGITMANQTVAQAWPIYLPDLLAD